MPHTTAAYAGGHRVIGCMKVKTQRESLARMKPCNASFTIGSDITLITPKTWRAASSFTSGATLTTLTTSMCSNGDDDLLSESLPSLKNNVVMDLKTVRFHRVELREYSRILGDNPSPARGPPVALSWTFDPESTASHDLEHYESMRERDEVPTNDGLENSGTEADPSGGNTNDNDNDSTNSYDNSNPPITVVPRRRRNKELILSPVLRWELCREAGHSKKDIASAVRRNNKYRERRATSIHLMQYDSLFAKIDGAKRRMKKFVRGKTKTRTSTCCDEWKAGQVRA